MRLAGPLLALVLSSFVLRPAAASATMVVIQPSSQDAYISKDRPNRIAGANPTNTRIRVLASPPNTQVRRGLVQFPLGAIPAGSTVNTATVELNAGNNATNPTLTHGLHRVTAGWLQSSVKWNNAPPFVAAPTATAIVGDGRGFKSFTVTTDVQVAVSLCADDHGWIIKDEAETASNDGVNYTALEEPHPAELADRPKLTVTFTPPPCTTDADCADANFCTINERCQAGVCVVDAVNCDDGDPCTDDICDCAAGCINAPICNDGFSCTVDTCDPVTLACTNTPVDTVCNGPCATGTCVADPDSTTVDPVTGCQVTSVAPSGTSCNDGDGCTQADACDGDGQCVPGAPLVCGALDDCHAAGTCDPATGQCSNPTKPAGSGCSDGNACTQGDQGDRCDASGQCVPGTPVVCSALDDCHTAGTCDPTTGQCSNPTKPSGSPCSDGNACTKGGGQGDRCDASGRCVPGAAVVCAALDDCHLAGTCDPATGQCSNPAKPSGAGCSDGNGCTLDDRCNGAGSCVPGTPRDCAPDDLCREAGACDPASGVCVITSKAVNCDDPVCAEDAACLEICGNCIDDNHDGLVDRDDPQCDPYADGHGGGTGDPKTRGKAMAKCQKAFRTAGLGLATAVRTRLQRCADTVFQCLQQKPGEPACLTKARARCATQIAALSDGPAGIATRLADRIRKACGAKKTGLPPLVGSDDLCRASGLGFESESDACSNSALAPADLLAAVTGGLIREHRCRAAQLFGAGVPRGAELLALGGVDLAGVLCLEEGAQGGSLGLGSPKTTGKAATKCQKGIGAGGARFVQQVVRAYQGCAEAVFQCIERKPGDLRCRVKAEAHCRKVTAALFTGARSQEAKLRAGVAKSCGGQASPLALSDLRGALGLGYAELEADCHALGVASLASLDDVSECLVRQHLCRAEQILTSHMPRSHELLDLGGALRR